MLGVKLWLLDLHHGYDLMLILLLLIGITDDDLRETAYEILLACAGASGYAFTTLLQLIYTYI